MKLPRLAALLLAAALAVPMTVPAHAEVGYFEEQCLLQDQNAFQTGSFGSAESSGIIGGVSPNGDINDPNPSATDLQPYYEEISSSVTWELADGVLVLSGQGPTANCGGVGRGPFHGNPHITTVVAESGITQLSSSLLTDLPNLETIILMNGATRLDMPAQDCPMLRNVIIGADLQNGLTESLAVSIRFELHPQLWLLSTRLNCATGDEIHFRSDASIYTLDTQVSYDPILLVDRGRMADLSQVDAYYRDGLTRSAHYYLTSSSRQDPAAIFDSVRAVAAALPQAALDYLPQELQPGSGYVPDPVVTPDPVITPTPDPDPVQPVQPEQPTPPAAGGLSFTEDFVNTDTHLRTSYDQANYLDLTISGSSLMVRGQLMGDDITSVMAVCGSSQAQTSAANGTGFSLTLPLSFQGRQSIDVMTTDHGGRWHYYLYDRLCIENTGSGYRFLPSRVLAHNKSLEAARRVPMALPQIVPDTVAEQSRQIVGAETDDYAKVFLLHKWVAENIAYDYDALYDISLRSTDSAQILAQRRGVCAGYSILLRDLIRAQGIPAVYGANSCTHGSYAFTDVPGEDHAHTEAYVDGHWITMDATWDSNNEYRGGSFQMKPPDSFYYFDISSELFALDHMLKEPDYVISSQGFTVDSSTGYLSGCSLKADHVTVPNGVTEMQQYIFANRDCSRLTLPEGLTTLQEFAFAGCYELLTLDLPATVTAIPDFAFDDTFRLTDINFSGTMAQWKALPMGISNNYLEKVTVHCTDGDTLGMETPDHIEVVHPQPKPSQVPDPSQPTQNPGQPKLHSWAQADVAQADALGLVPEGLLGNDYTLPITRGDFASLAVQLYKTATGSPAPAVDPTFDDCVHRDMAVMYSLGVINGYNSADRQSQVRVGVRDPITREQAAAILARLSEVLGRPLAAVGILPFTDPISSWAFQDVSMVYVAGIMGGYSPTRFGSRDSYTAEQSILTMLRTFRLVTRT